MNVVIRDKNALAALRPTDVALYLRSRAWESRLLVSGHSSVWSLSAGGEAFEVVLPSSTDLRDYALRLGELLNVLAVVEDRSQEQIYRDLLTASADVLRIRIADPASSDGTLLLEEHVQVAQKARDLVLAAACATTERRPVWQKRKPTIVMDYMRQVRIGQSERGSYIVTIISPISPELEQAQQSLFETREPPFERRVTTTLALSLQALGQAAEQASLHPQMAAFDATLATGVNANLCDAVAGMSGTTTLNRTLDFSFSWSPGRAIAPNIPQKIRITSDQLPMIREAGRLWREREPVTGFELIGPVIRLERSDGAVTGKVTIIGLVDERPMRVVVELAEPEYAKAVEAHRDERAVLLTGTLVRDRGTFSLRNPGVVEVAPE